MSNTDAVIRFNPDGSLTIPNDLMGKLNQNSINETPSIPRSSKQKASKLKFKDHSSSNNDSDGKAIAAGEKRKRRKNGSNMNIKPPKIPKEGECHFCFTSDSEVGETRSQDGITVHYRCLVSVTIKHCCLIKVHKV